MNLFAYRTTGLLIKTITELSKAKVKLYGIENIPSGSVIFVLNHFTRMETFLMPYMIFKLTQIPVWSLASYEFFKGAFGAYLEKVGAVSTRNPERDLLIVKTLLNGEANWIIFPEGRMVKNKKIIEKGRFMISYAGGKRPPHTGAALLALRAEFYRQRIKRLLEKDPEEAHRLLDQFKIEDSGPLTSRNTWIVPVCLTYFPIRARENTLSNLATHLVDGISDRLVEEIMTEGTMLLSGVDLDIRFGEPIKIDECLSCKSIERGIGSKNRLQFDDPLPLKRLMHKEALKIMQRYMAAIYSMTSVNHDHLFASLLRFSPHKKFKEHALRRKLFLLTGAVREVKNLYLHQNLQDDQVHLLTDDRYGRVSDFLSVAIEKEILKREGRYLIKDRSKFSSPYDFHRARIDNPVEVMANAVEPLTALQRIVRWTAWLPDFWVRHKVAAMLQRRACSEFDKDYRQFFVEGESKKKEVGSPFLIRGSFRRMGVVLVHGYMAAPLEMKELAEYLARKGLWVYVPRVKGHGTSPDDLAQTRYPAWVETVDCAYALMRSLCRRVVVGGFSNGAGLTLDLAARTSDMAGVFAVSTPLRLQDFSTRLVPAVDVWNRLMKKVRLDDAQVEFVENHPENPHINYLRNPIAGVRELERFMGALEPKLGAIKVPALVIQGQGDPVVNPKGSVRVFQRLGSEDKTYVLFSFNRHGIVRGEGAERVHRTVWEFIERLN
ncbi:MAG: alpha/beta hydrolase [Desulfobacterales bacterium]|jgi:esterase/lipase/1-acyl-sn-glycerol-3-phosphate acyltransferase